MTLTLYYHPFSSFCQKAVMALYENDTPFEAKEIDLADPVSRGELAAVWPLTKFPVLRDEGRGMTVPESSPIILYLAHYYPGPVRLVPSDLDQLVRMHVLDRVLDNYVDTPLGKIVADHFRPEGRADPHGVEEAKSLIARAYGVVEAALGEQGWLLGDSFSLADCAAAPALFYANIVVPFGEHRKLAAYFSRLLARASFARAVEEARPFRPNFPLGWPDDYG